MARGSYLAGTLRAGILGAALVVGLAAPGYAGDPPKLALTGSTWLTTDYIFRSYSLSSQNPAVQAEFDLTYGIFYAYIWGSSTTLGSIELDYGIGVTPKWGPVTFNIAGLAYTFPGLNPKIDYFELKTGASWTSGKWSFGVSNYWSPDYAQLGFQEDAIEGTISYAFAGKLWNFFTPSISGTLGYQAFEQTIPDYTYWNAGLILGFLERWSADIRYYDTDYSQADCVTLIGEKHSCDARAVGTIKATF